MKLERILVVCLVWGITPMGELPSAVARDPGHAPAPKAPAPGAERAKRPSWTDRKSWLPGRYSPLAPVPDASDEGFLAAIDQNAVIVLDGLRVLRSLLKDPVKNKAAIVAAFEDYLTMQRASRYGIASWIDEIEKLQKEGKPFEPTLEALRKRIEDELYSEFAASVRTLVKKSGKEAVTSLSVAARDLSGEATDYLDGRMHAGAVSDVRNELATAKKPMTKELEARLGELSGKHVSRLALLAYFDKAKFQELAADHVKLTGTAIDHAMKKHIPDLDGPAAPPRAPIESFPSTLSAGERYSRLYGSRLGFDRVTKELREGQMTRAELVESYDSYVKKITGKSLREIFKADKKDLDHLASMDERWIVIDAMKQDLREQLAPGARGEKPTDAREEGMFGVFNKSGDELLARVQRDYPRWGSPKTYADRATPFQEVITEKIPSIPTPSEFNRERERRGYGDTNGNYREWAKLNAERERKIGARKSANEAIMKANDGIRDWAFQFVTDRAATRRDLVRMFDSPSEKTKKGYYETRVGNKLADEWELKNLDEPATYEERRILMRHINDHYDEQQKKVFQTWEEK